MLIKGLVVAVIAITTTVTAAAHPCMKAAESMGPYKGRIAKIEMLEAGYVKDEILGEGIKYTWKYQVPGRPMFTTWSMLENGRKSTGVIKNGELFFWAPITHSPLVEHYKKKGTIGYVPIVLTGKRCEPIQVDFSTDNPEI
jgi:hypothetical protein